MIIKETRNLVKMKDTQEIYNYNGKLCHRDKIMKNPEIVRSQTGLSRFRGRFNKFVKLNA